MFGGAGVYADGVMFAIVVDDVFYLKADETSQRTFEGEGMSLHLSAPRQRHCRYALLGGAAASPGGVGGACFMGAPSPSHRPRRQGEIAAKAALTNFKTVPTPAA